jgi:DICT domain-containing protein
MADLGIKELATRTGIAAGTIRMWEQRYGFPEPARTPTGYRRYTEDDVATLRRAMAYRTQGLSIPAALERAREATGATDRPSFYGALCDDMAGARPMVLAKSTLIAMSRAMEEEAIARGARPVVFAAFQDERFYRQVEHRYRALARTADAVTVFARFAAERIGGAAVDEVGIEVDDALGGEWVVVIDAPGYSACLLAWEQPDDDPALPDEQRRFECLWTIDPQATRRAALVGAQLVARRHAERGAELQALLEDRPLATEAPAPALTALTNRMLHHVERA